MKPPTFHRRSPPALTALGINVLRVMQPGGAVDPVDIHKRLEGVEAWQIKHELALLRQQGLLIRKHDREGFVELTAEGVVAKRVIRGMKQTELHEQTAEAKEREAMINQKCAANHCSEAVAGPLDRFCPACWERLPEDLRGQMTRARSASPQAELILVSTAKKHLADTR